MARLLKLATMLAKVEDTEGVDSLPEAAQGFFAMVTPPAPAAEFFRPEQHTGAGSILPGSPGARRWEQHVEVLLRGSGAAYSDVVVPKADALLRMAGFQATLDNTLNAESWTYTLRSSGFESFSVYSYLDGVLTKLLGCRALPSFVFPLGAPARAIGELRALWSDPVDGATVVPTGEPSLAYPVMLASQFALDDGVAAPFGAKHGEIRLDIGRRIAPRSDGTAATGYAGMAMLAERAPVLTFEAEATTEGDFDWWAKLTAGTQLACSFQVGPTGEPGQYNRVRLSIPVLQFERLEHAERDGILQYRATCLLVSPTGVNDELSIIFD